MAEITRMRRCEQLGEPRMDEEHDHQWFAIQVRPNAEQIVFAGLTNKGYETFLPTYRSWRQWADRKKLLSRPLFPGYLFCRFNRFVLLPILSTLGVMRILGNGNSPISVPKDEIASLQAAVLSQQDWCRPWPILETGSPILVQSGPLRGVKGVLRAIQDENFLIIGVPLLQRSVAVKISTQWVSPQALL